MTAFTITPDDFPVNPRDWESNVTTFLLPNYHQTNESGEDVNLGSLGLPGCRKLAYRLGGYDNRNIFPVYEYRHSGSTFKTGPFWDSALPQGHARFDSFPVGFAVLVPEKVREAYGVKNITEAIRKRFAKDLEQELSTFEAWVNGWVNVITQLDDNNEPVDMITVYTYDPEAEIPKFFDVAEADIEVVELTDEDDDEEDDW